MSTWDEVLERGKQFQPVSAVVFLRKLEAVQLILAWQVVPREISTPDAPPPRADAPPIEQLRWCWGGVSFDSTDWARLSDVSRPETEALGLILIEHGLVFPDGTCHEVGLKYANQVALRMVSKVVGGGTGGKKAQRQQGPDDKGEGK